MSSASTLASHAAANSAVQVDATAPTARSLPALLRAGLRVELGIALVAVGVGVAAWWFADSEGLMLLYADARSHMTIARRLIDGPNSGVVQLGTVWLPLPHVALAPFTMITSAWRTGAAAAIVGVACLATEAVCAFRIVRRAAGTILGGWVAALVLVANPGWLYLHMTALGESVLFATALLTVAGLAGWAVRDKAYSGGELALFCGLPAAAAVLSRYDGWALAAASAAFVGFVAQRRWHQWRYTLRCLRSFCVLPAVAAAWWLWFNFRYWGDPLEFQRGKYSAQAQQQILADAGLLPDQGDLGRSLHTYFSAMFGGSGWVLLAVAAASMLAWAALRRLRTDSAAPWLLAVVPAGFYVASLYTGQIALRLGTETDPSMFNLRYGLQMLPGCAIFAGLAVVLISGSRPVGWRHGVAVMSAVVIAAGSIAAAWPRDWRDVPVISEGLQQLDLARPSWAAAELLADRADTGVVAIDDSVSPMLPVIAVPLDRVAAPFSGPRWSAVLDDPREAEWLFVNDAGDGDALSNALAQNPSAAAAFDEVFSSGDVRVLHRRDAS